MRIIFAGGRRGQAENWLRERMGANNYLNRFMLSATKAVRDIAWAFVRLRNTVHPQPTVKLPVPVISIGNITVGGTGKTPLTLWLAHRLTEIGYRPAILTPLSAGADETQEHIGNRLHSFTPMPTVYAGRDRVKNAERAIADGATVILLDDGFQYRRIRRDVDIVLWDAMTWLHSDNPFLREPLTSLKRATAIVLSKADAVNDAMRKTLCTRLNEWAGYEKVVAAFGYVPTKRFNGMRIVAATSVANPHYFVQTAKRAGCEVAALICFPDHYRFTPKDATMVVKWAQREDAEGVLTTRKDAVKWWSVWQSDLPLLILDVQLEWLWGEAELWQKISTALNPEGTRKSGEIQ